MVYVSKYEEGHGDPDGRPCRARPPLLPGAARQKGLPGKRDPGAAFQQLSGDVDSYAGWGTDGV